MLQSQSEIFRVHVTKKKIDRAQQKIYKELNAKDLLEYFMIVSFTIEEYLKVLPNDTSMRMQILVHLAGHGKMKI